MNIFYGRQKAYKLIKPHLYSFLTGFNGSKEMRGEINNAKSAGEILQILKKIEI